jgi:hypothetical protein
VIILEKLLRRISLIENCAFSHDVKGLTEGIADLSGEIDNMLPLLNEEEIKLLNEILNYINTGIGNKDYILVADMLRYELIPLISKSEGIRGLN